MQSKKNKIRIFPEFVVKMIMLQIFKALMYLNEKNIIHGDLKLENILLVSYNDNENIKNVKINKKQDGFIEAIKHDMKIIDDNLFQNTNTNRYKKDGIKLIDEFNKKIQEDKRNIDIKKHNTNIKFGNHFHFLEKNEQKQNIQETNKKLEIEIERLKKEIQSKLQKIEEKGKEKDKNSGNGRKI